MGVTKFTTTAQVQALKLPKGVKQCLFQSKEPGLMIRCGGKNRTWVCDYFLKGKRNRKNIGRFLIDAAEIDIDPDPENIDAKRFLSLKQATRLCRQLRNLRTEVLLKRAVDKKTKTVDDLWLMFQERNKKRGKAESTMRRENDQWLQRIQPAIGAMKVVDVTPEDLDDILDPVAAKTPISANRLHSLLGTMFAVAFKKRLITANICRQVERPLEDEIPRDRTLNDCEIRALFDVLTQIDGNPRDIIKMLLFTGQRVSEVCSLRWSDLDLDAGVWDQRINKARRRNQIPLSKPVLEILNARVDNDSEWVFPSRIKKAGHFKDPKKSLVKLRSELDFDEHWTLHDLRRTFRTLLGGLGVSETVAERLLNHSQEKLVATYNKHKYLDEKREAMDAIASEIERIVAND